MNSGPVGVGIVGAGVISKQYLTMLTKAPDVNVIAIGDMFTDKAQAAAEEYGVPVSGDLDTVLTNPDVELVINLTIPAAHAQVGIAALSAGKHVYGEKPLGLTREEGEKLLAEAASRGLRVGSAPDTFLCGGMQAAKRAIDSGLIGAPIAALAALQNFGPERWHPNPEFLFQVGAGPLFDLGPYYLTALVNLLGPVEKVSASARQGRAERVIGSGPKAGTRFAVEVPTHVSALVDFAIGATASTVFSFDSTLPRQLIEITGTEGTLWLPDPNRFEGPLRVRRPGSEDWEELSTEGTTAGRGIGAVDMARSLRQGVPSRASGELAMHVLDVMIAISESAERGEFVAALPTEVSPAPLAPEWDPYASTL